MNSEGPVGVFDSGLGGLSVLRALRAHLPAETFLYLGDTARLPYGAKTRDSIIRFTTEAVSALLDRGSKLVVIACNTATAAALPTVRDAFPHVPVVGTIEPGAAVAAALSRSGRIAVIATAATVTSGVYEESIRARNPKARIRAIACPLFVTLAEEGWMDGPIAEAVAHRYLAPVFSAARRPDCLVLGCTHFPPLRKAIEKSLPRGTVVVDPAEATALAVKNTLEQQKLARSGSAGAVTFLCTDAPERFAAVGSLFLDQPLKPEDIRCITLEKEG